MHEFEKSPSGPQGGSEESRLNAALEKQRGEIAREYAKKARVASEQKAMFLPRTVAVAIPLILFLRFLVNPQVSWSSGDSTFLVFAVLAWCVVLADHLRTTHWSKHLTDDEATQRKLASSELLVILRVFLWIAIGATAFIFSIGFILQGDQRIVSPTHFLTALFLLFLAPWRIRRIFAVDDMREKNILNVSSLSNEKGAR